MQLQPLVDALRAELLRHSVLHADETPVAMLKPGHGKTHRAYLWSYCTTTYNATKAVVFDFADSRGGQHARDFLGLPGEDGWHGSLVCDDFSGYKACFEMGVTEAGCLAHARRKFHELWVNHQSTIGEQALKFFAQLYDDRARGRRARCRSSESEYDRSDHDRWPMPCTCGWPSSARRCPRARPRSRRSTTAWALAGADALHRRRATCR